VKPGGRQLAFTLHKHDPCTTTEKKNVLKTLRTEYEAGFLHIGNTELNVTHRMEGAYKSQNGNRKATNETGAVMRVFRIKIQQQQFRMV
jgi:hypothetical protein